MQNVSIASENEWRLQRRIRRLTARGRPDKALRFYDESAPFLESATTHHAAFVAAREMEVDKARLEKIERYALACADYDGEELNFGRDWALYYAEVEHDLGVAESMIKEVLRSRSDDEGQDRSQLPIDRLGLAKVKIYGRQFHEAFDIIQSLHANNDLDGQTTLDIEWWYFISSLTLRKHHLARRRARRSLDAKIDSKPDRNKAWRTATIPWIGARVARLIVTRKLGL